MAVSKELALRFPLAAGLFAIAACLASSAAGAGVVILFEHQNTDANFQGTCRIFGPGDCLRLPGDVANRISSGRHVQQQDLPPRPKGQR